ncbi:hypothetical protein ACP3WQ_24275, partial [Salmonella enterica]|uniref:hypothetical protein n=1 Tax=Salmonella enterica TaxID=28901 RepID=UPI003CF0D8DA
RLLLPVGVSTRWLLVPSLLMEAVTPALALLMALMTWFRSMLPLPLAVGLMATVVSPTFRLSVPEL